MGAARTLAAGRRRLLILAVGFAVVLVLFLIVTVEQGTKHPFSYRKELNRYVAAVTANTRPREDLLCARVSSPESAASRQRGLRATALRLGPQPHVVPLRGDFEAALMAVDTSSGRVEGEIPIVIVRRHVRFCPEPNNSLGLPGPGDCTS